MLATVKQVLGMALLTSVVVPATAWSHGGHKDDGTGCKHLGCWLWTVKECEETVYDVEYKEVKKTIRVPYIREIKEEIPCKVCKPFDSMSLRDCPEIHYCRSAKTIDVPTTTYTQDECGNCCPVETCEQHVKTCITRGEVSRQIPVLEWQAIPVEDKVPKTYYVRDWKDEEVVLRVPVKTPRVITRKVWTRVPLPDCGCENACIDEAGPMVSEPVELVPQPTEPTIRPDEPAVPPLPTN